MGYDLRRADWIAFRRLSGAVEWGPPSLLTDKIDIDPVVAIAAPRPDFTGAITEFLIGLISYALAAEDEDDWLDLWNTPPTPEVLQQKLDALPAAFDLDGNGPRFLQDFTPSELPEDTNGIEGLLIDAAGGQTTKLNKDLFIKRDRVSAMGLPAAAMALLTLQTFAPSGGQGHRTSMRGGGPLTTLIDPRKDSRQPLWQYIWANAETIDQWEARGPDMADGPDSSVFPWLAPTRTSDPKAGGQATTPQDGHPMQAYFGMPRRLRVLFEKKANGCCDLTGLPQECVTGQYQTRNYGVEYDSWRHPLSPYYRDAKGQWLPTHGQPGGFCWRDWAGLLYADPDSGTQPAQAVGHFLEKRARDVGVSRSRLCVFGYDMDNMKARGWVESVQPALALDKDGTAAVSRLARQLAEAASLAGSLLLMAVKAAKFSRTDDAKGDWSFVKAFVWSETEAEFYRAVNLVAEHPDKKAGVAKDFLQPLTRIIQQGFDIFCPSEGLEFVGFRRYVAASHSLNMAMRGYGKLGGKMYEALELPVPEKKKKTAGRKKKGAAA